MDWKPVTSSNIDAIGYDPATKTLGVRFKNGGTYHYHDVDAETHQAMVGASSVGSYLHGKVKGRFKHSKA